MSSQMKKMRVTADLDHNFSLNFVSTSDPFHIKYDWKYSLMQLKVTFTLQHRRQKKKLWERRTKGKILKQYLFG